MKYLISGGGTGGHVYPAIAIADAIRELHPKAQILFAGTRNKMEWLAVQKAGYEIQPITISGLHRNFKLSNLILPFKLVLSLWQSRGIIKKYKPDAVICTGGYVSGPIGWVASFYKIPLFLQEQNSYPGWTTRKLAPKSTMIFTAFEAARKFLPVSKIILCGNPTRKELHTSIGDAAHEYFGFSTKKKTLLILGGSGGAKAINEAIVSNIQELHDSLDLQIIWQSGSRYLENMNALINPDKFQNLRLYSFVDHMTHAYSAADVVISRSGASICSELMVAGIPSIMVPSPNVAGDHQTSNAQAMVDGGAAIMLKDHELASRLVHELQLLLKDEQKLVEMKKAALKMAKPEAANHIVNHIYDMLNQTKRLN